KDPAVAMELFGKLAELYADGARDFFIHLIHVGDRLAMNLFEDNVRNLASDGVLERLEQAEALKGRAGFFEVARGAVRRIAFGGIDRRKPGERIVVRQAPLDDRVGSAGRVKGGCRIGV